MAQTTFSGPIAVGSKDLGAGVLLATRSLALVPQAAANTDFTLYQGPGQVLRATALTTTAFTGATVTVQIGTTQGGADIVAATDIKAAAAVALVLASRAANPAGRTLHVRIVQTTPTAVGAGVLVLEFVPAA